MILTLTRIHSSAEDTIGGMFIDGVFACFTLEDQFQTVKVYEETRIPGGEYVVKLSYSPKFTPKYGHDMLHLQNVPNFTGILIHPGNREKDTAGCILVGDHCIFNPYGISEIRQSIACYNRIYPIIAKAIKESSVQIKIIDEKYFYV